MLVLLFRYKLAGPHPISTYLIVFITPSPTGRPAHLIGGFALKYDLGVCIRHVSHLLRRIADKSPSKAQMEHVTGTHGWVIGYLYDHRHEDIFQRDLERAFNMRRSTATGILQLMEKNELILRQSVPRDARLKKLTLTPKALKLHEGFGHDLLCIEKRMVQDIPPDELSAFQHTLEKITHNLEAFEKELTETEVPL